jgi:hypothetical protein
VADPPGGTVTVRGGASNGAKYFWYAETDSGAQWAGDITTWLPNDVFDWCWGLEQQRLATGDATA